MSDTDTVDAESPPATRCLDKPIDPGVRIGHVHLKVADIERSLAFYCGVLGFELIAALRHAGGVLLGRRLSSPHRHQHLGEPRRRTAATALDRPVPSRHPLSDPRRRWPMRCAG